MAGYRRCPKSLGQVHSSSLMPDITLDIVLQMIFAMSSVIPPSNGSQPNLVVSEPDANGCSNLTRAFNTETAEQRNARLNGVEAQCPQ